MTPDSATRTTVLYLMGTGRSGSTVLANTLGQVPGLADVGELRFLWERGLQEGRTCGCGVPVPECPRWSAVLAAVAADHGEVPAADVVAALADVTRVRQLPRVASDGEGAWLRRRLGRVAPLVEDTYRHVARVAGARVVVDSSKLPTYGRVLDALPGIDLRVLHLVRDPRAAAWSWKRAKTQTDVGAAGRLMEQRGAAKSALLWRLWNGVGEHWWSATDRYLPVRYEDFAAAPRATVEGVLSWLGEDPAAAPFADERTARLGGSHGVSGNPDRFRTGLVTIAPDERWRDHLDERDRRVVSALAGGVARRHGYRTPAATR